MIIQNNFVVNLHIANNFYGKNEKDNVENNVTEEKKIPQNPTAEKDKISSKSVLEFFENSKNFETIFAEMQKNVPDRTSTIEEKELAISYIKKLLACDDISEELFTYWQNKKEIIEQEIQLIKNEQQMNNSENVEDVWQELETFVEKYQKTAENKLENDSKNEYYLTYNNVCISFYERLLRCKNATPELNNEYQAKILEHLKDKNYIHINNDNEKFEDVYKEMLGIVPDVTNTKLEKELAISYIERLLACDDISQELSTYWQNKKEIIEQEFENIK